MAADGLATRAVAGNRFVLLPWAEGADGPALARELCAQKPCSDGLLIYRQGNSGVEVRMWNPDGTEDFCANGIACVAQRVGGGAVTVRTPKQQVAARISGAADEHVRLQLGAPDYRSRVIPTRLSTRGQLRALGLRVLGHRIEVFALSTGTTHCVIPVRRLPPNARFERLGRVIACHRAFPQRTSIVWCVIHRRGRLAMRVWERGVGETRACGTGAVAAALVAARNEPARSRWVVQMAGGHCTVLACRVGRPILHATIDPD